MSDRADLEFDRHRGLVFGIAYRMLGGVTDAEDLVQDVWLRWQAQAPGAVERPEAWLATVATRLAVDRLRSARHTRETYVGEWLPEPLVGGGSPDRGADPAQAAELADSLHLAFLVVLERLDPVERAVFLLREVFEFDYEHIAATVDRRVDHCRQIAHRAAQRVRAERPARFDVDPADAAATVERFVAAVVDGEVDRVVALLTDDVVLTSDGGAERHAARRPVVGADRVARFVVNIGGRLPAGAEVEFTAVNGDAGLVVWQPDEPPVVMAFEVVDRRISAVRAVLAPAKVRHLRRDEP